MADNWDRLKARTDADIKLAVPTSRKSASNQLEVVQTRRQARRSKEMENADTNPPIEASLVVAPKRSGSPLQRLDANKKKMSSPHPPFDNSKPKAVDEKLPATSKQLEAGKSCKKSKSESKDKDSASKRASSVAGIEEASGESMVTAARGLLGPSGNDEYYLEHFYKFYADYKACNDRVAKRLLKYEASVIHKHHENVSLKSRLNIMTDKYKNMESRLDLEDQLKLELHEKYINALKARTIVEKECESRHEKDKSLIEQEKAKIGEKQLEIANLRAELGNMQETNRGIASYLVELQTNLKNTEETSSNLLYKSNEQAEQLEQQKLKIQDAVAEREMLERQNSQLKSELEERTLECNDLKQRHQEELANQLETSQYEKEQLTNFLNERIEALEAARNVLIEINEEYSKQVMELKADGEAYNKTISIQRSAAIQQDNEIEQLTKSHDQLREANLQQLSLHSAEIQEYKNKLQVQAESLKAEQENLIKETQRRELLTSQFEGERERYQADIDALKTALEHRDRESSAEQAKMQSLQAELDELRKINSSLKDDNKQKDDEISAAKKMFNEEIKCLTNNLKNKIFGLQEDLKQKENKLVGLEHEKNGIITQLKNKMSRICSTIEQPIIASGLPVKSLRRLPRKTEEEVKPNSPPPSSSRKRKAPKMDYINLQSDFESDNDEVPLKVLFSKRENLAIVRPQEEDPFDALKKK